MVDDHVREIARFLGRYPPFDSLERTELEAVAATVEESHAARGEAVLVENGPPGTYLYVVRDGTMELDHKGRPVDVVTKGQLFGHPTLLSGLAPEFTVRAREDTDLYLIPREAALSVLTRPEGVTLVAQSFRDRVVRAADAAHAMPDVRSVPVTSVIRRPPLFCAPETTVRAAAQLMSDESSASVLVRTAAGLGIVTDADLRRKVLAGGMPPETPVSAVMTLPAATVSADTLAPQASIEMMQQGVSHMPVVDAEGRVLGVVSAGSLMNLDALSPFALRRSMAAARDEDAVAEAAARVPALFVNLLDAGLDGPAVTRVITVLSDVMTSRLLDLSIGRAGPPPVAFAWLALGSGARKELTLASDQDNALAFEDADDPAVDGYFAGVADEVNRGLARCGFAYDQSGVHARDRHWRLSRSNWMSVFSRCLEVWDWNHLLRASIAFDFRRVAGGLDMVTPLASILHQAPRHGGFLSGIAHLASQIPSPLGFRGRLTGPIDIKKSGLLPVENLARFYAFARGITVGSTVERLLSVEQMGTGAADDARALREAYMSMSLMRLRHHAELIGRGVAAHNVIDTETLRPLARVTLQEALRTVAAAQKQLP
jgi:CBS domain-containing protein